MDNPIKQFNGEELERLRKEVLDWIEKNERKKNIKASTFQKPSNFLLNKQKSPKNIPTEKLIAKKNPPKIAYQKNEKLQSRVSQDKHPMHIFNNAFFGFSKFKNIKNIKLRSKIFFIILGVFFIAGVYTALAIYIFSSRDPVVRVTSRIFRFPAIKTSQNTISYAQYLDSYHVVVGLKNSGIKNIYWLDLSESVVKNYIRYFISKNELSQKRFIVDNHAIEKEFMSFENMAGGTDVLRQWLKKYNIKLDEFKEFAVIPNIIIREAYKKEKIKDSLWAEKYKKIQEILERIRSGSISVQGASLEIGDNTYGKSGGDSGFIGKGDLEKEVGEILFSSRIGEISDIIETRKGMYIVQLTDIFPEIEMVRANIIFIKHEGDYSSFVESAMKRARYKIFIKK